MSRTKKNPTVLCILDGWGYGVHSQYNAIEAAKTPFWDSLIDSCPHSLLATSGLAVGLPDGQMGNSEVGHMNIGSGRVVMQELPKIDQAIEDASIFKHPALLSLTKTLHQTGNVCHLMGLFSPGGVHSHQRHIIALAEFLAENNVSVMLHLFLDGRDTPPNSAKKYITKALDLEKKHNNITIATVSGRYYAMDRDNRWDRVSLAYQAIVDGDAPSFLDIAAAIDISYGNDTTDEFFLPQRNECYSGMNDGDAFIMANFRADRVRQIMASLLYKDFDGFKRSNVVNFSSVLGMVEYSQELLSHHGVIFPSPKLEKILGEILSERGFTQLRIAETEKYAHVTFFFNGGKEDTFEGEERILVPSPHVASYDLKPEMSATEVTEKLIDAIESHKYDFIVVNYANTDMVGHTGNIDATVKAVETIDTNLKRLVKSVEKNAGTILITADHGNAELMFNEKTGVVHTAHTINPVPLILCGKGATEFSLKDGKLSDIAPTILSLMGIDCPDAMTGECLLV